MKILHTADWHIGTFDGPEKDGVNLRALDTQRCLEAMVEKARKAGERYEDHCSGKTAAKNL